MNLGMHCNTKSLCVIPEQAQHLKLERILIKTQHEIAIQFPNRQNENQTKKNLNET